MTGKLPDHWHRQAADYFQSYREGRYDSFAYLTHIYPEDEIRPSDDGESLAIGRPGADGLEFSLRRNMPGVWVWYPLDNVWRQVADDIAALERDWVSGALKV